MIDSSVYVGRPHPGRKTVPLPLRPAQRARCEALLQCGTTERRVAQRAQGLLLLADGVPVPNLAHVLGVDERTVFKWKRRFAVADPTTRLTDAHRTGRPPSLFRRTSRRAS